MCHLLLVLFFSASRVIWFSYCRLKAHFEVNPKDLGNENYRFQCLYIFFCFPGILLNLNIWEWICIWADLLKHDKDLSKKPPAPHLRDVPDYLLDAKTQEACKMVKLARAAMRNKNSSRRQGPRKFRKSDPLKSFSAEVHGYLFVLQSLIDS